MSIVEEIFKLLFSNSQVRKTIGDVASKHINPQTIDKAVKIGKGASTVLMAGTAVVAATVVGSEFYKYIVKKVQVRHLDKPEVDNQLESLSNTIREKYSTAKRVPIGLDELRKQAEPVIGETKEGVCLGYIDSVTKVPIALVAITYDSIDSEIAKMLKNNFGKLLRYETFRAIK